MSQSEPEESVLGKRSRAGGPAEDTPTNGQVVDDDDDDDDIGPMPAPASGTTTKKKRKGERTFVPFI
jgi:peptidylprolyl isomerase domain and WD repeat-containing protein 1